MKITIKQFILFGLFIVVTFQTKSQTPIQLSKNQFTFTEGPVWDGIEHIYFTDIPKQEVIKYNINTKVFSLAYDNSERANGLMFDINEKLIVCEGGTGKITKRELDGTLIETLVSTFNGVRFNGPNDLCIDEKGGIYFTDPSFEGTTQPSTGLYYVNTSGELLQQDTFGSTNPNGIIISPNGKTLYVNNTSNKNIYKYDINETTGALSNRTLYGEVPDALPISEADGMAIDTNGNLYVTAKTKVHVFDGNQLAPINTISFPEKVTNCTFGGPEQDILYVTASNNIYQVSFSGVTGIRHPFDLSNPLNASDFKDTFKDNTIYPLPVSSNTIHITNIKNLNAKSVKLFNLNGKAIHLTNITNKHNTLEIILSNTIANGTYLLHLKKDNELLIRKVILQR